MNSIGNDVVALAAINRERSCQPCFYRQVFSPGEAELYPIPLLSALPFEYYVHLLWSIKESAYKYLQRLDHGLVFSPTRIRVNNFDAGQPPQIAGIDSQSLTGNVSSGGQSLSFRSCISQEYIHTWVTREPGQLLQVEYEVQRIAQTQYRFQSAAVRNALLNKLQAYFPDQLLQVDKHAAGYPQILASGKLLQLPVSLSHHQHYIAYAYAKDALAMLTQVPA